MLKNFFLSASLLICLPAIAANPLAKMPECPSSAKATMTLEQRAKLSADNLSAPNLTVTKARKAPQRVENPDLQPVMEVDGVPTLYYRNVFGTYMEGYFMSFHYGEKDAAFIAKDKEGNLWVKDIVPMSDFFSFTKLEPMGEGKYKVQTPQRVGIEEYDGVMLYYDLYVMDKWVDPDDGSVLYEPSEETDFMTFTLNDDGVLRFDTPYRADEEQWDSGLPDRLLGIQLSYKLDGEEVSGWNAYSMMTSIFTPCEEQPNASSVPTDMATEDWTLVYDAESVRRNAHKVPVGIDGDDMWIGNLWPGINLWIKGKIEGDQVVFEGPQFMNTYYEFFEYFAPARSVVTWSDDYQDYYHTFEYTDKLVLKYDRENKTLIPTNADDVILITWDLEIKGAADYFENPTMAFQTEPSGVPEKPRNWFYEIEYEPGVDSWVFFVSPVSTTDYLYNGQDLFFRFYANGEPYALTAEAYNRLPYDMIEVPYYYEDRWDVFVSELQRIFAIYTWTLDEDLETFAVTLCYRNPKTGDVVESEPLIWDVKNDCEVSGIATPVEDAEPISVSFFTVDGKRVDNPTSGFYIKSTVNANGKINNEKIIIK